MTEQIQIPSLYSNSVGLISSFYDFVLTFSMNEPHKEKGKIINQVRPLIKISMSPTHFKAFTKMCAENMQTYEKTFGKITLPEPSKETAAKKH